MSVINYIIINIKYHLAAINTYELSEPGAKIKQWPDFTTFLQLKMATKSKD